MTAKSKKETITLPEGTIKFSVLRTPRLNEHKGREEYSMKVYIKGSTPGAAETRKKLEAINIGLPTTKDRKGNSIVEAEGDYCVGAKSIKQPKVFDKNMQVIPADEIPMIESGKAVLVVTAFEGSGMGGGINLEAVQLLDFTEFQGSDPVDEEQLLQALRKRHA